jgi:branched-chain amino acid transport system substrate-binding protein
VGAALAPAGLEKSVGAVTAAYLKDPTDKVWASDKGYLEWLAFMKQWYPRGNLSDAGNAQGYSLAQTIALVLKQCGDDLTRENVMKQAASLKDVELPMLLPGIRLNTSPEDFFPVEDMRLARFDGTTWVVDGSGGGKTLMSLAGPLAALFGRAQQHASGYRFAARRCPLASVISGSIEPRLT